MSKLFIFAEDQQAGVSYARNQKLKIGSFEVLSRPDHLYAYEPPLRVLLVGSVDKRWDYEDLTNVLEELNAKVDRIVVT